MIKRLVKDRKGKKKKRIKKRRNSEVADRKSGEEKRLKNKVFQ